MNVMGGLPVRFVVAKLRKGAPNPRGSAGSFAQWLRPAFMVGTGQRFFGEKMSPLPFRPLAALTADQQTAARAYTSASPRLHHLMQGRDELDCPPFAAELAQLAPLLPNLVSAARTYQLTEPLTLYAGIGNGYSALGSLWSNDPKRFVGLDFVYGGVFSTSVNLEVARHFMSVGITFRRVLLTIDAKPGLLGLPTAELGPDNSHEGEVLIAAATSFCIVEGSSETDRCGPFVHLKLANVLKTTAAYGIGLDPS